MRTLYKMDLLPSSQLKAVMVFYDDMVHGLDLKDSTISLIASCQGGIAL